MCNVGSQPSADPIVIQALGREPAGFVGNTGSLGLPYSAETAEYANMCGMATWRLVESKFGCATDTRQSTPKTDDTAHIINKAQREGLSLTQMVTRQKSLCGVYVCM